MSSRGEKLRENVNVETGKKRNATACENCRARRIKCSGHRPCAACVDVGIAERCETRRKARPTRLPRIATQASSPGLPSIWKAAQLVATVQNDIERWAISKDTILSAALSDELPVRRYHDPHPGVSPPSNSSSHANEASYVHECLPILPYFDFIADTTLVDLLSQHHSGMLMNDTASRALLYASFCLGRSRQLAANPLQMGDDPAMWYKRCEELLSEEYPPSRRNLIAMHLLHMYVVKAGGVLETRNLLKRMAKEVSRLELYDSRNETDSTLLFATIYKDSWFATLCDSVPFLNMAEALQAVILSPQPLPEHTEEGPPRPRTLPLLVRLTELENELMLKLHAPSPTVVSMSLDYVAQLEDKWSAWNKEFRETWKSGGRRLLNIFANVRFHWMVIHLYYSLLDIPDRYATASAVLARSISRILYGYAQAATDSGYFASWPDLRRIVTCAHMSILLYEWGEFDQLEVEKLLGSVRDTLRALSLEFPMATDAEQTLLRLMVLSGLDTHEAPPPGQGQFGPSQFALNPTVVNSTNPFPFGFGPGEGDWLFDPFINNIGTFQ